jgi:hypothetical protein
MVPRGIRASRATLGPILPLLDPKGILASRATLERAIRATPVWPDPKVTRGLMARKVTPVLTRPFKAIQETKVIPARKVILETRATLAMLAIPEMIVR